MTTKPKPQVRLVVTFTDARNDGWGGPRFAHFTAEARIMGTDYDQRFTALSPDAHPYGDGEVNAPELRDLCVTAQTDSDKAGWWYGWEVEYHDVDMNLDRAAKALPVLRKVDRHMAAVAEQYGRPADLITYATRAARALTSDRCPFLVRAEEGNDFEGTGYRSLDADGLRYWLDARVKEWRAKHGIPEPSASA